jgi:hypothetical protein
MFLVNFYLQQFAQKFLTQENFPYQDIIKCYKMKKEQARSTP